MREIFQSHLDDIDSKNTSKGRKTALNRFGEFIGDKDLEEVDKYDLKDWVNSMKGDISDLTIGNYYYGISAFYSWLEKWGERYDIQINEENNPFEAVELEKDFGVNPNGPTRTMHATKSEEAYRALSVEQVKKLIENVPEPTIRNQLVVRLLYQTGVRSGELITIELDDIDREKRQINIDSLKSDGYRTVYYKESLDTLLSIYLDGGYRDRSIYSESSPYLFLTRQSEQLSKNRVGDIVRTAAENAGIQGEAFTYRPGGHEADCSYSEISPHVLRHTMAHHSIHEGEEPVDLVTLSRVMGHDSLNTTQKYLESGTEQRRKTMQRAGPGFGSGEV